MKIALRIVLVLIVLVAGLGLLAPRNYHLEREIVIDRPVADVFSYITLLQNSNTWNAWMLMDPTMKTDAKGTDGTVGYVTSWESTNKNVGTGEQEIKAITLNERLDTEIRFTKPFKTQFDSFMTTTPIGETHTKVVMGIDCKMPFPLNAVHFVMSLCCGQEKEMITQFDNSLNNLKTQLEQTDEDRD
ncbi:MAG: SRPBCC family protein [Candidatus Margulisiibacteriota bacterium]